ncbi:FAD-binding protein [Rhodococcus sp. 14-2470-1a]|uniref:FAD-binding protein n=1 Tax=Rhodococcus sp. 14-2470-1a TaxID=2023150 RepID=UPI000B9B5AA5|nr:FAD-binding protein [Rhodococcus sp. 14-2470-1a]OZF45821.1 3-oxosteroid 1-dehydrogenase [Rhodococcus sp. 14-2470-1a]
MTIDVETFDVIVVGSGGGLIGAYIAASRGLRTLVIEKTDKVGGTTAYSGAGLWYPGSAPIKRAGIEDGVENARAYLRALVDDSSRESLQDAYLTAGVELVDELESSAWFPEFVHQPVPDYFASAPGSSPAGNTIFPAPIPAAELGDNLAILRKSIPDERWGDDEGPVLSGGRALIGRALMAFLESGNGTLRLNTALESLVVEDGRVVGVNTVSDGEHVTYRAGGGVLLAAGGFEHNEELRAKHGKIALTGEWSNGVASNTGDALNAGVAIGADIGLMDEAWFVPGLVQPDGRPVFQTGTRGGIWVNGAGERFTNETQPYDQSGHAIYNAEATSGVSHMPVRWILDQKQIDRDSFGGDPALPVRPEWFESGALVKADTLEELAELIGVPFENLSNTVKEFNAASESGVDEKFHRGETTWDNMFQYVVGFPALPAQNYMVPLPQDIPNPLLGAIDTAPYYAATIRLSDIGTKGGLRTDDHARVLRADGEPIAGLYAAGNTMAAMSGGVYPGAGTPIGSSLAFSYLAVQDIAHATERS